MPQKLPFLKQHGIQFYISLFSSFLSFSNAFPSDLQSIKDAIPFRPQASSPLSSQTTTVGSTRAQSSSSTQQPGDRRTALLSLRLTWHTALLSPAVGLLLSLRLTWHTALLSPPAVGLLLSLKLTWHAVLLFPAVGLLLSLKLTWHAAPLFPAVGLLLSLRLVWHAAPLFPAVDRLPFPVGLPRSSTPFLATDLLYLQHNSPQTRQSTDIPCSRSRTQPRQAEKWRARSQGLPAYAWTETEWKVKLVLWKPQTLMLQYPV